MNTPSELFHFYEAYLNIYEAPFEITGPHSYKTGDGRPQDDSRIKNTPTVVGSYKGDDSATRKKARNKADKLNQEYGASVYRVNRTDEPRKRGTTVEDSVEYVLDYLIDEGYTDSYEGAEAFLETMSDEWLEGIIEAKVDSGLPDDVKSLVRNQRRGLEPKLKSTNDRRIVGRSGRGIKGNIGDPLTSAKYERYHTNNPNGYPGLPWN